MQSVKLGVDLLAHLVECVFEERLGNVGVTILVEGRNHRAIYSNGGTLPLSARFRREQGMGRLVFNMGRFAATGSKPFFTGPANKGRLSGNSSISR